jgi:hypothetical protein
MKKLLFLFITIITSQAYTYDYTGMQCGTKHKCSQMKSCKEAYFYLEKCGIKRLDRDKDGIPCERMCGN